MSVCIVGLLSCKSDDASGSQGGDNKDDSIIAEVTDVTAVSSSISIELATDKALYRPGETVRFTADNLPTGAKIRYRHLDEVVFEQDASAVTWEWTAPSTDFTGYLVDVYTTKTDGGEMIFGCT